MTRKDYILIAAALNAARSSYEERLGTVYNNGIDNAADRIADSLARDNARFDRGRFLAAAGVPTSKE